MPTLKEKHAWANATWYQNNKLKRIQYAKNRRKEFQDRVDQVKLESGCVDCGYDEHPRALDFDHLRDKEFSISLGRIMDIVGNGFWPKWLNARLGVLIVTV